MPEMFASIYGLVTGAVYQFEKSVTKNNKEIGGKVEHTVYLWYQHDSKRKRRRHKKRGKVRTRPYYPCERNIFVQYAFKPNIPGHEMSVICVGKIMSWDTIRKYLKGQVHTRLGEVTYNGDRRAWSRFYKMIGAIPK